MLVIDVGCSGGGGISCRSSSGSNGSNHRGVILYRHHCDGVTLIRVCVCVCVCLCVCVTSTVLERNDSERTLELSHVDLCLVSFCCQQSSKTKTL